MTGFARVRTSGQPAGWSVEIRSVNHRYFELGLKLPPSLYDLEDRIRELCHQKIRRGKVNIFVGEADGTDSATVVLNEKALQFYLAAIQKLRKRYRLQDNLSVRDLLSLPQVFTFHKKAGDPEKLWSPLKKLFEKALAIHEASRAREGQALAKDLRMRLGRIEKRVGEIEVKVKKNPKEIFDRLKCRVDELIKSVEVDPDRVSREVAFLAERSDVTEEIVRLKSHLHLFRHKLQENREVGKELDFVLQEMNREINTLGSKSQDFGISQTVVAVKSEIEKLREQIQNIE